MSDFWWILGLKFEGVKFRLILGLVGGEDVIWVMKVELGLFDEFLIDFGCRGVDNDGKIILLCFLLRVDKFL